MRTTISTVKASVKKSSSWWASASGSHGWAVSGGPCTARKTQFARMAASTACPSVEDSTAEMHSMRIALSSDSAPQPPKEYCCPDCPSYAVSAPSKLRIGNNEMPQYPERRNLIFPPLMLLTRWSHRRRRKLL